jgi:hypothetical protein
MKRWTVTVKHGVWWVDDFVLRKYIWDKSDV